MSSLVFVRDAHGRPLMPMSAAYARTLIHQGKAHVWPHPAVSVIQLTHAVATPTLRPVLVGIALSTKIADLVIVVEQMRGSPSTLHIAVDLQFPPLLRGGQQTRWGSRRRRIPFTQNGSLPRPAHRAQMLLGVMQVLCAIIPISHFVFLPSGRPTALIPPHAWWIEQRLAAGVHRLASEITVAHRHTRLSGEAPHTLTGYLTQQTAWAGRQSPELVACVAPEYRRSSGQRMQHASSSGENAAQRGLHMFPKQDTHERGQLCTTRHQRRMITGVVHEHHSDHLVLRVPHQVTDQGIEWTSVSVPMTPSLHLWSFTPILVLPLTKLDHPRVGRG